MSGAERRTLLDPEAHISGRVRAVWRSMRREGGVHRHPAGTYPEFWSVTSYDLVKQVYADPDTFSSAHGVLLRPIADGPDPGAGRSLALSDPPRHGQLRRAMAGVFSPRAVRELRTRTRAEIETLLQPLQDGDVVDFCQHVAIPLTLGMTCRMLGYPDVLVSEILDWSKAAYETKTSLAANRDWLFATAELIDERRSRPTGDLISTFLHARDASGQPLLDAEEVFLNCENLIGATENAGLSLAESLSTLCRSPRTRRAIAAAPRQRAQAVDELLRLASSAVHSMRVTTRDTELGGHALPSGSAIVLWLPSANRDESVFPSPGDIRLDGSRRRHLALGSGVHTCIGAVLARMQLGQLLDVMLPLLEMIEIVSECPTRSLAVAGPKHLEIAKIDNTY